MDNEIWFYGIYPGFVSLLCILLTYKAYKTRATVHYIQLFVSLAVINACQMMVYAVIKSSYQMASYSADLYLIAVYFLFAHFIQLALSLSENNRGSWPQYIYAIPVLLTGMHIKGLMVDGYYLKGNTILHNDGPFSWAFDLFVLSASFITVVTFFINYRQAKEDYLLQSKNILALILFIPFVVAASILIILSTTTHAVPVVVIIPSMSMYIVLVFYYISRSLIIDMTIGPIAMLKRLKAAHLLLTTLDKKKDLDEFNRHLQLLRYKETLQRNKNNFNAAAEELNVHPTTIRNALKENSRLDT